MTSWPDNWPTFYNGISEPCDMLIGPCVCGASHYEGEFYVTIHRTQPSQLPAAELAPPIDPPWLRERIKLEVDTAISRQAADELVKVMELERELAAYKAAAPLCEQHKPDGGHRSGCLVCGLIEYSNALSRIDYLCGGPNEMEVSGYDVHVTPELVVGAVSKLLQHTGIREREMRFARQLATAQARIEELERELTQAIVRCGEWATKASEMAGTVQGWKERATAAEAERDRLREVLPKLTLKWRIDDFNGKNFPTKREAADEVEAALREPTDA
jgi:hypothetical protein